MPQMLSLYRNCQSGGLGLLTEEKRQLDDYFPIGMANEGTLIQKWQKCGQDRCQKCKTSKGHGPYWWRVKYDALTHKHIWKYVGKTLDG